MIEERFNCAHR